MAKKKSTKRVQMLSPENYIKQKARKLPVKECYISSDWKSNKMANVIVVREHVTGNHTIGVFLVDLLCLGVKDAYYMFNEVPTVLDGIIESCCDEGNHLVKVDYPLVHNVVYAALEFANDYGFAPHKGFGIARYVLDEDTDEVELMPIECGENDRPLYVVGPYDSESFVNSIVAKLERSAGFGNYKIINEFASDLDDDFLSDFDDEAFSYDLEVESDTAFQFKIQIKNISKPPVWRRVVVPSNASFLYFHKLIQEAFGWEDYHLFSFSPKAYDSYPHIGMPSDDLWDDDMTNAEETLLNQVFNEEGQKYTYVYDFGDDWQHSIVLEKIIHQTISNPSCLAGKGMCLPEDCGGVWGYADLLEIIADNKHSEHLEMREWLGLYDEDDEWDVHEFDLDDVNSRLDCVFGK